MDLERGSEMLSVVSKPESTEVVYAIRILGWPVLEGLLFLAAPAIVYPGGYHNMLHVWIKSLA